MPKKYEFIKVIKTLMTEEHLQNISALASIYHFLSNVNLIPWQTQLCFQTKSIALMNLNFAVSSPPPYWSVGEKHSDL